MLRWGGWGGGKAGEVEGGGVKSIALPKLGRCSAGLKITPGQQTMSGRNDHYWHNTGNYKKRACCNWPKLLQCPYRPPFLV